MSLWTFKQFVRGDKKPIKAWYDELPNEAQAKFDVVLEQLRDTPNTDWSASLVKRLTGYRGIYEIRLRVKNVLYRPLGFFGPNPYEFTLLVPAREKGNEFEPKNAPKIAIKRKKLVQENKGFADECDF